MSSSIETSSNEFPNYSDADTMVIVSPSRRYLLHASTLRRNSKLFNQLLAAEGPTLSKKALGRGVTLRYRLVLSDIGGQYRFRRVDLDSDGRAIDGSGFGMENDNGKVPAAEFKHYETLLRAFYNLDMQLEKSSIATVLRQALGVLDVAEYIGAVPIIAKTFEGALIARGQALYQAIAQSPCAWIDLGYRLSSRLIFRESLVHLVGKYNEFNKVDPDTNIALIDRLRAPIRAVVDAKVKILKELCVGIEQAIGGYYPGNMMRHSTTGRADRDPIGRADYANDILSWMALGAFKHWFANAMALECGHTAEDFGYDTYMLLAKADYLDRNAMNDFHVPFPMSNKGQAVVEAHLSAIKMGVKPLVNPLLIHRSELDIKEYPIKWLTCTEVKAGDYPWVVEAKAKKRALAEATHMQEADLEEDEERHVPLPSGDQMDMAE